MSKLKLLLSSLLFNAVLNSAYAETQYVTENLNTYLRLGAG